MNMRRVESFLLRIVVPDDTVLTPEHWHGRIQHVASGAELQIDELAQAVIFISSHLTPLEDLEPLLEPPQPKGQHEPAA